MKDNNNSREDREINFPARYKKNIKNLRGFRESLADEESMSEIKEFGNEISIADIWDNPGDDIS
ncbi:hypothetical protein [Flavobacterium sp.]|uniref:hypothetical protein n=1 Tax=Flavobacterium sp. TaxID=239 RepID=UPI0038FC91DB